MSGSADVAALPVALRLLAERLEVEHVSALGRGGRTLLLRTRDARMVVKRIDDRRPPAAFGALLAELAGSESPLAPRLVEAVPGSDGQWYGVFEYVDGTAGATMAATIELLRRLRAVKTLPPWPLDRWWLERLSRELADDPRARELVARLAESVPVGPRELAHGDFNLPNVVTRDGRALLIDWEELGAAPPGFDAGWLAALARVGGGVPWDPGELRRALRRDAGVAADDLAWSERLGVLRLLFRARTLAMPQALRGPVTATIRRALFDLTADA